MANDLTFERSELPPLEDLDDPGFNPFSDDDFPFGDILDPYPRIRELAAQGWLHKGEWRQVWTDKPNLQLDQYAGEPHYFVLGYDKVQELLLQGDLFTNYALKLFLKDSFGDTLTGMDGAEHGKYRKILQKVFLPQTVRKWGEPIVDPVVRKLIGAIKAKGNKADLVQDFTFHFPFLVIYGQMGLPPTDSDIFQKLAITQTAFIYHREKSMEAAQKLGRYFSAMIRQRRENPGEDLVSALATAEVDGEMLPENVVISFLRQLINAGGDTTYRATSTLLQCLLQNPDQLDAVRRDRSLVPAAIEEALRWEGPVMTSMRMTSREVTIDGHNIPKGAWVDFVLGSANRDPEKFEDPDRYDLFRDRKSRLMTFSTGPHVCIGQHLARVEMERALNAVLDGLPNVRLDPEMPPPQSRGYTFRKPDHLYVLFDS